MRKKKGKTRKKPREEKSPCGRGRFSSSLKSADPSLPPLLQLSFSHLFLTPPSISLPLLCLPPTFILFQPTSSLFLSPPPPTLSLFSPCAPLSLSSTPSFTLSISLFLSFHSFVLSLSLYSTSLILSLSQWESCRQTQAAYTNVTIFDKTHTHIFSCHMLDCTHTNTPERKHSSEHVWINTHTHTL